MLTRARNPMVAREVALLAVLYVAYEQVRAAAPTRMSDAFASALQIERIERALHVDLELPVNLWLAARPALAQVCNVYYQLAHPFVTLTVLGLLWLKAPSIYRRMRTTLVSATLIGLVGYWLVPTAPPRFAMHGAVDVLDVHAALLSDSAPASGLVNLYAAMPSLHAAWSVWCALAVSTALARRGVSRTVRSLAWLYPLTTTLVVIATANHYVLDVVAGGLLVLACDAIVRLVVPVPSRGPAVPVVPGAVGATSGPAQLRR